MTTSLIAKEKFFYNGRNVEKDEQFEAEDQDVMLLTHHHTPKAATIEIEPQKAKEPKPKAAEPAPPAKPAKPAPPQYQRRDMKVEDRR